MKRLWLVRRSGALLLSLVLLSTLSLPVSAFFWNKKTPSPTIPDFSKNALVGDTVTFSDQDFSVQNGDGIKLTSITITVLPDPGAGTPDSGRPASGGRLRGGSQCSGRAAFPVAVSALRHYHNLFLPAYL